MISVPALATKIDSEAGTVARVTLYVKIINFDPPYNSILLYDEEASRLISDLSNEYIVLLLPLLRRLALK